MKFDGVEISIGIDLPVTVYRPWFSTSIGLMENIVKQEATPTRVTRIPPEVVHHFWWPEVLGSCFHLPGCQGEVLSAAPAFSTLDFRALPVLAEDREGSGPTASVQGQGGRGRHQPQTEALMRRHKGSSP